MAKVSAKGAPNPFQTAQRAAPAAASKVAGNIFVAANLTCYDGSCLTAQQVADALTHYSEGAELKDQADALLQTNRPLVLQFARTKFAQQWLMAGARPKNPKLTTNQAGTGPQLTVVFMDAAQKLDDNSYANLVTMLGQQAADDNTTKRDVFTINPELLEEEVDVNSNGKRAKMRVMDAIAEALQTVFAPSPEILQNLFTIKPQFETKKGLLDKAPGILCPDKTPTSANRLGQFLETVKTQVKVGSSGTD